MEVKPRKTGPVDLHFSAPPSKSYTHRALIAAALGRGESSILEPLEAEDTRVTMDALRMMGVGITRRKRGYSITGTCGTLSCSGDTVIDMQNSGTSMRLLASVATLCGRPVVLTGSPRMKERPLGPLAEALSRLGATIAFLEKEGFPPVRVSGNLLGGSTRVDAGASSQFVSSILIAAPCARRDVDLELGPGIASPSYIDLTLDVMRSFGIGVERDGYRRFLVPAGQVYRGRTYAVEGDYSSASYFFAIAALCGGRVRVRNLNPRSCQGDRGFLDALSRMGCSVGSRDGTVEVLSDGELDGIDVDMSSAPDTVQTLCMVAARAKGETRISGIGHLRYKESDRLEGTARLLRGLGGDAEVDGDSLIVTPSTIHGGTVDPGGDHRTAMSFAVLGLATGNVKIIHAECVSKSFPGFWEQLAGQGLL